MDLHCAAGSGYVFHHLRLHNVYGEVVLWREAANDGIPPD